MRMRDVPHLPGPPAVYVIGTEDTREPVKLGYCANVWAVDERLAQLQTGNPRQLVVHQKFAVSERWEERWAHNRFWPAHLRGEWFDPMRNPRLLDVVEGRLDLDDLDLLEFA